MLNPVLRRPWQQTSAAFFAWAAITTLLLRTQIGFAQDKGIGMSDVQAGVGVSIESAAQALLGGNPQLLILDAQIAAATGRRMVATSAFNVQTQSQLTQTWTALPLTTYQIASYTSQAFSGIQQRSSELLLTGDASKLYRNGVTLGGHFELNRLLDNITSPRGNNLSTLSVGGTLPLLRNRGSQVVGAQEEVAKQEIAATRDDYQQGASQLVNDMANAYWALVANQELLAITKASEQRGQLYRDNVQTLVDADQAPRGDLSQVEANLAQRTAQRIAADQNVIAAEQALAVSVGLTLNQLNGLALQARDLFPQPPTAAELQVMAAYFPDAVAGALARRQDYAAALQRISEQQRTLAAARNGLLPELNLSANAGYTGLQGGRKLANFFDSAVTDVRAPNAQLQLSYRFPVGNDFAKGQVLQAEAGLRQAELNGERLRQQISAEVKTSESALVHAAQQVAASERAVSASQAALDGEREKYKVGMGSIVDLVTVEDRLNLALGDRVQAHTAFALAIAQVRFATGTLVQAARNTLATNPGAFTTLPDLRTTP